MKLVVTYSTSDGCTYNADHVVPIEYKSIKDFKTDFYEWAKQHKDDYSTRDGEGFLGTNMDAYVYFGSEYTSKYEVMTLEDWWENNCVARIVK